MAFQGVPQLVGPTSGIISPFTGYDTSVVFRQPFSGGFDPSLYSPQIGILSGADPFQAQINGILGQAGSPLMAAANPGMIPGFPGRGAQQAQNPQQNLLLYTLLGAAFRKALTGQKPQNGGTATTRNAEGEPPPHEGTRTTDDRDTGRPVRAPGQIGGFANSTVKNGQLELSDEALDEIAQSPADTQRIVEREITGALKTNDTSKVIKELVGVNIKTGFSEERKTIKSFQIYQDIIESYSDSVLKSMNLTRKDLISPEKTTFDKRGGVILGQAAIDKVAQDPASAEAVIKKELADTTGSQDMVAITEKVLNMKLDTGDKKKFGDELYGFLLTDLTKRIKEYS